ncbi:hypothetical protein C8Q79DRAFT_659684 [Trametes meyenii]|nr:hypothetical protein C8Q79DRAFT_659684 [Trametes meyenii]
MLVVHPNSQCDVCLDFYSANREPHVISCGHVFCYRCLQSLLQTNCPLCRMPFKPNDVRRLHVDKASLPPDTPQSYPPDLEMTDRARQFQTQLTRIIRGGATASDLYDVQSELKPWLSTQRPDDHADLRATYTLLYRFTQGKVHLEEVEQTCSNLEAALEEEKVAREEERLTAAAKYDELEKRVFEERELTEKVKDESARLREECEDLKAKVRGHAFVSFDQFS